MATMETTARKSLVEGGAAQKSMVQKTLLAHVNMPSGDTGMILFVRYGDDAAREKAFKTHPREVRMPNEITGWTPVHEIAVKGPQELRALIRSDPELGELKDNDGVTPNAIIEAVETGTATHRILIHAQRAPGFIRSYHDDNPC